MKPSTLTIFQLFESERRFVVPLFQRPYVWNQDRQWKPLWDDIATKADTVLSEEDGEKHRVRNHFLGAVVLNQIRTFGRQIAAAEVIDGQQRLTTLQIILVALRDFMIAVDEKKLLRRIERVTENDTGFDQEVEKYKVWPTTSDRAVFEHVLSARSPDHLTMQYPLERKKFTRRYLPRPRLAEAYFYFYDAIQRYVNGDEESRGSEDSTSDNRSLDLQPIRKRRLEALITALTQHLELVVIELEEQDDPQVIFETLNARGEPLLPSDLIRNFVFLEATRQRQNVERLYETYWHPFDESTDGFWKAQERQGRLTRPRIDLFFFHYLSYRVERDLLITHLFQEFREWWSDKNPVVETELQEIQLHSKVFRQLFDGSASARLNIFARRLRLLDTSTVYPFLLFLLGENREAVSTHDRDAILTDIESYLIRRMICGLTTKNYNRVFPQLLRQMRKVETVDHASIRKYFSELQDTRVAVNNADIRTRVRRFFNDLQGDSVRWPTDEEFRDAWLLNPVYQTLTVRRVMMVLEALDLQISTAAQEQVHLSGELSVEHVMPQHGKVEEWPLPEEPTWGEDPGEYRQRLIHTFGNLTLLTQKLNSTLSNGPFMKKRPMITKNSRLQLNAFFQDYEGKRWTEQDITERGKALFEVARVIWPGPDTSS